MRFWSFVVLFLFMAPLSYAQCGITGTTRHVPPNYADSADPNYTGIFFAPPNTVNGAVNDTLSSCAVTQLTYGFGQYGTALRHEYASMTAMNANDTLIEILDTSGTWSIIDLNGNIIVPEGNVPWSSGVGARWDASDPLTIYYISHTAAKVFKAVIPSNYAACKPTCTVTSTQLHDFTGTFIATSLSLGGGEGDIQNNSPNYLVLCGLEIGATSSGGCEASAGKVDVFLYNFVTDTVGTKLVLTGTPARQFDSAQLTADGRVHIDWDHSSAVPCTSGPCYYGVELYDANMNWVSTPWYHGSSHTKETLYNGNYYLVLVDAGPYVCAEQGIVAVNLNTLAQTCILNLLPWVASPHVGASEDGSGWVIVSHVDYESPGAANYPLAANWNLNVQVSGMPTSAGYWGTYSGEEILVRADGSSIYRLTWNRSRPNAASYWKAPRGTISRDGKYVIYDSDYGQGVNTPATDYTDVFMVNTGLAVLSLSNATLSNGFVFGGTQ